MFEILEHLLLSLLNSDGSKYSTIQLNLVNNEFK